MTTVEGSVPPFTYYGGKQRLAERLVQLLPDSQVFVEVFGGSGAVLLSRPPRDGRLDVYNDVDEDVVTFFRVLRERPVELQRALRLTPYSRAEFDAARASLAAGEVLDDVERARRFYVVVSQSFGTIPGSSGWGGQRRGGSFVARPIVVADDVDGLERVAARLRYAQVDRLDWRACLDRYDAPRCAFYLDPPYVHETRNGSRAYRSELDLAEHEQLVERLLTLEGSWLLSGFAHDVYAPLDDVAERFEYVVRNASSQAGRDMVEVVWRRLAPGVTVQQQLEVVE